MFAPRKDRSVCFVDQQSKDKLYLPGMHDKRLVSFVSPEKKKKQFISCGERVEARGGRGRDNINILESTYPRVLYLAPHVLSFHEKRF